MKYLLLGVLAATPLAPIGFAHAEVDPLTKPIETKYTAKWLAPQAPVKIYGNTYFVGFAGMSNVLIKTDAGLVLIDGALPQAAPMIEANIKQLGFRIEDVKYILNTEAHFDHAGGLAALSRDTGAAVLASASGAKALAAGHSFKDDPQFGELLRHSAGEEIARHARRRKTAAGQDGDHGEIHARSHARQHQLELAVV